MKEDALISSERKAFHKSILKSLLKVSEEGVPSNADKDNRLSKEIANSIVIQLGKASTGARLSAQTSGDKFEECCAAFLRNTFPNLDSIRPGSWTIEQIKSRKGLEIAAFQQYEHLDSVVNAIRTNIELKASLGTDYLIGPDILIYRQPEEDHKINSPKLLVDGTSAGMSGIRKRNSELPILHASVSCKWTIRSDRAQNVKSEALNLIRNRKGHLPHIAVITAEPFPNRIASLALGTGDIDFVYHFALYELKNAVIESRNEALIDLMETMCAGNRLRDISDLPLDLAV